eukprot:scaffold63289_cov79-Phaeocystis_antarctica.AAC.2
MCLHIQAALLEDPRRQQAEQEGAGRHQGLDAAAHEPRREEAQPGATWGPSTRCLPQFVSHYGGALH